MKKTILPKEIIEQLENEDFTVREYPKENYIEFQKYSDAGQDFSFIIDIDDNGKIQDIANSVYEYYDSYNPCEEALLWVDDEGHGKNGAPDLEECIEDMKCCKQYILDVYNIINGDFVAADSSKGEYKYKVTLEGLNVEHKIELEFVSTEEFSDIWQEIIDTLDI